jgi:hypothetical protein
LKDSRIEKNHVDKIRLTDSGPFQVWNGFDADSQNPGARVLAVIGAKKSLRVNYTGSMQPPQVTMGPGWVDVVAGQGTALTFSGPKSDCHYNQILWCTNRPFNNLPAGTLVCMCTGSSDSICCSSDTGIFPKSIVPIGGDL